MNLPIDIIPNTQPPRFRWRHIVDTPNGKLNIPQEGVLASSAEQAVETVIGIAKQALMENAQLRGEIAAQSRQIERSAAKVEQLMAHPMAKKGKA